MNSRICFVDGVISTAGANHHLITKKGMNIILAILLYWRNSPSKTTRIGLSSAMRSHGRSILYIGRFTLYPVYGI